MDKCFTKPVLTNLDDFKTTIRVFNTCLSFYIKEKKGYYIRQMFSFVQYFIVLVIIILGSIKCMYIIFRFICNSVVPNGNDAKMCLVKIQKFPM